MEQKKLDNFKRWFDEYVACFYGDDAYVNANIKMKECHTRRTCQEMRYLAEQLGLDENKTRIAETIALFHDVGRFEQFARYRTYNDTISINHCLRGVEVLRREKVLAPLDPAERQIIERAVEYHGMRQIPADVDGQCLLFSKLIRDADKLDIFCIVTGYYKQPGKAPEKSNLEIE